MTDCVPTQLSFQKELSLHVKLLLICIFEIFFELYPFSQSLNKSWVEGFLVMSSPTLAFCSFILCWPTHCLTHCFPCQPCFDLIVLCPPPTVVFTKRLISVENKSFALPLFGCIYEGSQLRLTEPQRCKSSIAILLSSLLGLFQRAVILSEEWQFVESYVWRLCHMDVKKVQQMGFYDRSLQTGFIVINSALFYLEVQMREDAERFKIRLMTILERK